MYNIACHASVTTSLAEPQAMVQIVIRPKTNLVLVLYKHNHNIH